MDLSALIEQCTPPRVAQQTMSAIMRIESTHEPHAIGYKIIRKSDRTVFILTKQPHSQNEAVKWATWFDKNGYEYDAGAAQVHSTNFAKFGLSASTAFDVCANIRAGAQILSECFARAKPKYQNEQVALRAALSCYQSGNFTTGFRTGYVARVVGAAKPVP